MATDPDAVSDKVSVQSSHHQPSQPQQQQTQSAHEPTLDKTDSATATIVIPKKPLESDFHYESVDSVKSKYTYHDEPHSFETSMEFLEDYNHFQFEVLETTV